RSTSAISDHDTTAGARAARAAARDAGLDLIPGVEISSVDGGHDIHMLAYCIDPDSPAVLAFLDAQRAERLRRLAAMGDRLASLGCTIDIAPILDAARAGRSVGRPQLADPLVPGGQPPTPAQTVSLFLHLLSPPTPPT